MDQVRIKEDETNLMRPDAGHAAGDWKHPCHYLWRGPMYVKQNGDVYPCCQSYMLDGAPLGNLARAAAGADLELRGDAARCAACTPPAAAAKWTSVRAAAPPFRIPRWWPAACILHGRTVRRLLPVVERLAYFSKLPRRLLRPPRRMG